MHSGAAADEYFPDGQAPQVSDSAVDEVPASQEVQFHAASEENEPEVQMPQEEEEGALSALEYRPAEQSTQ